MPWRRAAAAALLAVALPASAAQPEEPLELVRQGVAHFEAGRLAEAVENLQKAVELRPEDPALRLLLAQVLFKREDLRGARREVDAAIKLVPSNAVARELSGDLYDREGLFNRAIGEWETAADSGGSSALAGKIERARREMNIERWLEHESSDYFLIYYDRTVPSELVHELQDVFDQTYDRLHEELGDHPRDRITIVLSARPTFKAVTGMPDWSGGIYDGKIRVPVEGLWKIRERIPVAQWWQVREVASMLELIAHEMTHAFLYRMASGGLPLWLEEGIATGFQGWDRRVVQALLEKHPPEGIKTLADVDRALRDHGPNIEAAYAAARLAVVEMEDLRGFGAIRRIIAGVGEGRPFAEVFLEEMRLELPEFEERWRRGLQ